MLSPHNCFRNCECPHLGSHSHLFRTSSKDRRRNVVGPSGFCGELVGAPEPRGHRGLPGSLAFYRLWRTQSTARDKAEWPPGCGCFQLPVAQLSWDGRPEGAREDLFVKQDSFSHNTPGVATAHSHSRVGHNSFQLMGASECHEKQPLVWT